MKSMSRNIGKVLPRFLVIPLVALASLLPGCTPTNKQSQEVEQQITDLLGKMSVEQKVAQLIMPDISTIKPADVAKYKFGTILNGGNSGPNGNERAKPSEWLALADAYWAASKTPNPDGSPVIPVLWATDALHGHNNVVGATIFPHNIGLGATRDPKLMEEIGKATAAEIAVTGIDWTFAPTLAVVRDDRWGRTYESYSEDKQVVSDLGSAMVEGLQGVGDKFLAQGHVIATAKHFFGDGGTGGVDTGDTVGDEPALIARHAYPYRAAIKAGAQTVMASFSSINGKKMHGSKVYLTDLLRTEMGFDGLVVGDWNGHGRIPNCTNKDCPASLNAGLDIFMVPDDWKALLSNTVKAVNAGQISKERLDEAVRHVLRVKFRYGLFDLPAPSARPLGGKYELLGSPEHRALARKAVSESLVLLKNDGVLPLRPNLSVLVAGEGADNIPMQAGGWTISWQGGGDLKNSDFPGAQSIYAGISQQVSAAGGTAQLSVDGSFTAKPDVAIVVFGEKPYAEFMGDVKTLAYQDTHALALMQRLKAQNIPVVAVFLTGRPLWVNRELNVANAFVSAWLPGSEGGGIADVLFTSKTGEVQKDFKGKLSFSWPQLCNQYALNPDDADYRPLYEFGFGLSYVKKATLPKLDERCAATEVSGADDVTLFSNGQSVSPFSLAVQEPDGAPLTLASSKGKSQTGRLELLTRDRNAQEDSRSIAWKSLATLRINASAAGTSNLELKGLALRIEYQVAQRPDNPVTLSVGCGPNCRDEFDITSGLALAEQKGWHVSTLPLSCFKKTQNVSFPIELKSNGAFEMTVSSIKLVSDGGDKSCRF